MAKIRATGGGRRSSCRILGRERRCSEPRRPSLRSSAVGASWLLICAGETFASRVCIAQLVRGGVARPSAAPTMAHAARPRVPAPPAGANCGAFPCLSSSDDGARARRGPARLRRCGSGLWARCCCSVSKGAGGRCSCLRAFRALRDSHAAAYALPVEERRDSRSASDGDSGHASHGARPRQSHASADVRSGGLRPARGLT